MWATITKPFAWLMVKLYNLTGNYGIAIIVFALAVNLILTPFMAKSKKGMMRVSRLQPKIQELQRRHEGNPQKLNQEMQKLYREEGANPMGGCLWSLIPFPILIALYSVIRQPLTRMLYIGKDAVDALTAYFTEMGWYTAASGQASAYYEIKLANIAHQHWGELVDAINSGVSSLAGADFTKFITDGFGNIDFGFLTMNLGDQPRWNMLWTTDFSDAAIWFPALLLFLIPFISAGMSWLSMKVGNMANPQNDAQAQATSKSMTMMMPLMSVWICFIMPGAMGIYWIANSVFGMARDFILTKVYKRKLDIEDAERIAMRSAREKEIEEKRLETETLRAEGKTELNVNTSKKKLQANEKQKADERKAAIEKANRAARREMLGIKETEKPASQVGNRRYARGRAYVEDRFTNPENAEEATILAAAESEGAASIDESLEADVVIAEETAAAETAAASESEN